MRGTISSGGGGTFGSGGSMSLKGNLCCAAVDSSEFLNTASREGFFVDFPRRWCKRP
jgi:hypothetical protein